MNCTRTKLLLQLGLRCAVILVICYGLYLALYGAFGAFQSWQLSFYTVQSNALVLLLFIGLAVNDLRLLISPSHVPPQAHEKAGFSIHQIKVALTWAISITGIVWHLLLVPYIEQLPEQVFFSPSISPSILLSFSLLHTWSPLLVFLDWLLFDRKGTLHITTPWWWLLIPLAYFAFICLKVHFTGPVNAEFGLVYPYPFIDFNALGARAVAINVVFMATGMLILGYIYWGIDRLLSKMQRSPICTPENSHDHTDYGHPTKH
ncbi:Pr6Pr family membrane protein [Saezia sanguinis]|uniref:Pr6Pr family membrane protein n=1 Tax=Saezia sanguinis TaxID=1965230 RepID=UPI003025FB94